MAGSASGIKAGRAYYQLFSDSNPLIKGLKGAEALIKGSVSATFKTIGKTLAATLTSPITAAAAVLAPIAATKLFAGMGAELTDMARRTGASAEALGTLGYAAKQTGSDLSAIESALTTIRDKTIDAARGGEDAQLAFARLGINFQQLSRMKPEDQLRLVAERLSAIQNPAIRAAMATDLLGSADLVPTLQRLKEFEARAKTLGITLSGSDAAAAKQFDMALADLHQNMLATASVIGAKIAPAATDLINKWISMSAHTREWIRANGDVFSSADTLWAFLKLQWAKGTDYLIEKWDEVSNKFGLKSENLQTKWVEVTSDIEKAWTIAVFTLGSTWDVFTAAVTGFFEGLIDTASAAADVIAKTLGPALALVSDQAAQALKGLNAQLQTIKAIKDSPILRQGAKMAIAHKLGMDNPQLQKQLNDIERRRQERLGLIGGVRPGGPDSEDAAARAANIAKLQQDLKDAQDAADKRRKPGGNKGLGGGQAGIPGPAGIGAAVFHVQGIGAHDVRTTGGLQAVFQSLRDQQSPAIQIAQQALRLQGEQARDERRARIALEKIGVKA